MANRVIRDWTFSENINNLTDGAEVFFVRLIMKADDYGCFYGNPKIIISQLYPLRNITEEQIFEWIKELESNGVVQHYKIDGKPYVKIHNFGQRLRTMKSKFPQPADNCPQPADACPPEEKRNEVETKPNEVETETEVANHFARPLIDQNGFPIL